MSFRRIPNESIYTYEHEKYTQNKIVLSANGKYRSAAVACDSAAGSSVGKEILEKGGSVVDAAIATMLANSVHNSQSMGIGGGFFMLHYSRENEKVTVLDARETAPLNSSYDMFKNCSKTKGGCAIAVPGEVKGFWKAHQLFGKLPWKDLFHPSIEMCNNGFKIPASQAKFLKYCEPKIRNSCSMRETFINQITNQVFDEKDCIKRPKLAKTFETIANEGESAFYNGTLTDTIVDEIQSAGGLITKSDLQSYECLIKEPISFKLRNNIVLNTAPPPSCGILLEFILALLDGFDYHDFDSNSAESQKFYHNFIESCKFAFGLRHLVGDCDIKSTDKLYKIINNQELINEYRSYLKDQCHPIKFYGSKDFRVDYGTAHTSIIGSNGDAVAITSSINLVFGSKVMGEKTNIIYNNQMDDFSCPSPELNSFALPNYKINYICPGKRPVSSMTPLIALDNDKNVKLVCGSSGGTRIITSTALTAARNLILNKDLLSSVDDPRIHHQLCPDEALFEENFDEKVLEDLSFRGHRLINFGHGGSAIQAISRLDDSSLHAVCDGRKGGIPDGF